MLKQTKWNDWVVLKDTETGEKTFALPESKTQPLRNWSWIERRDEKQNRAVAPGQESR